VRRVENRDPGRMEVDAREKLGENTVKITYDGSILWALKDRRHLR
jgi:hypothetical protein